MRLAVGSVLAALSISYAGAQEQSLRVTPDNFNRAETDTYFVKLVKDAPIGSFAHVREPASIADQSVIRMNRDTLYSHAVFDLDAGPVTLSLPDAGGRFMSMQVNDEDHYVYGVYYDAAPHTFSRDDVGTRYLGVFVRTLVDPNDPADLDKVHALQDGIKVEQAATGALAVPAWDKDSLDKVRTALLALAATTTDFTRAFGTRDEVDPVRHLMGTAAGWGGNPDKDATYLSAVPAQNDGKTVYTLKVPGDVPVNGFWSVSVYNEKGFFEPNDLNAYSLNNITAQKGEDGSVAIQFGGCDGAVPNCLPTPAGWNYTVRLYRPQAAILDGSWTFPEAQPQS